jgi:hypothetical protein
MSDAPQKGRSHFDKVNNKVNRGTIAKRPRRTEMASREASIVTILASSASINLMGRRLADRSLVKTLEDNQGGVHDIEH